jgi:hypothetical protein
MSSLTTTTTTTTNEEHQQQLHPTATTIPSSNSSAPPSRQSTPGPFLHLMLKTPDDFTTIKPSPRIPLQGLDHNIIIIDNNNNNNTKPIAQSSHNQSSNNIENTNISSELAIVDVTIDDDNNEQEQVLLSHIKSSRRNGKSIPYIQPSQDSLEQFSTCFTQYMNNLYHIISNNNTCTTFMNGFYEAMSTEHIIFIREIMNTGGPGIVLKVPSTTNDNHLHYPILLIEAPHTFFDAQTLPIANALFNRLSNVYALLFNTVHRGNAIPSTQEKNKNISRSGTLESDMAHSMTSYFQMAHQILVGQHSPLISVNECDLITIQIHGFRDDLVPEADLVMATAGTSVKQLQELKSKLQQQLNGFRILESPQQISVLTGMRNVQGQVCRSLTNRPFLHCEFSFTWRKLLSENKNGELDVFCNVFKEVFVGLD